MKFLLGLLLFSLLVAVHYGLAPYCADDAYLHFRIARNFVEHGVPFFNPTDAVMSTSSSVWTLFLSALFKIFGVTISAVAISNAFFLFMLGIVASCLAVKASLLERIMVAALAVSIVLPSSIQLMETPLALCLMLFGYYLYNSGRSFGFALLTLAAFTRLELSIFLLMCALDNLFLRRIDCRQALFTIVLCALPLVMFDLYYFGTLIPQTVQAKAVIYSLTIQEFFGIAWLGLFGKFIFFSFPLLSLAVVFCAVGCLAWWLVSRQLQKETAAFSREHINLFACGLLIFLTYASKRVYIFPWYVPLYSLPLLLPVCLHYFKERSFPLGLAVALFCAAPVLQAGRDTWSAIIGKASLFSEYEGGVRALTYRGVGMELSRSCPQCQVLAAEVGALGYEFNGDIEDAAGLVTPMAVAFHQQLPAHKNTIGGIIPPAMVKELDPDVIVGTPELLELVMADSELKQLYQWNRKALVETEAQGPTLVIGLPLKNSGTDKAVAF
ncbi:MAG: hypothetical protein K1X79_00165 [Oligoflexia bacterium]|nr:hypothetical protein [Oligoflexia bacterium]